ncbi:hypothetical protein ACWGI1_02435 [Streptomyces sp. NPDC054835]|uniref:hypothetical protein n=1 Tax=Streptomyces exfoliatus TaxID=1905 RepID=UPI0004BC1EDD|nr:hypothetical protein [Streptomyces exfoliatus]
MSVGEDGRQDEGLPLRWVVILLISGIVGVAVGRKEGLGAGMTVAIALAGLLHVVVRR